jgi:hypothetical protein
MHAVILQNYCAAMNGACRQPLDVLRHCAGKIKNDDATGMTG